MPLFRDYPQATSLEQTDAFMLDRLGVGTMFIEVADMGLGGGDSALYTFQCAGTPTDGAWIGSQPIAIATTFPADFGALSSDALPASLPTASAVFTVKKATSAGSAGVTIGTVTMATNGSVTGDTAGLAVNFAAGSVMRLYGPNSADATLADFAIAFPATAT